MSSENVLLINAIIYSITLIAFFKKYKFSVGVIMWMFYTVSAWSSFLFVQQPLYSSSVHASVQTFFPCAYLYFIFYVSMLPLMKLYRIKKLDELYISNSKFMKCIMVICTIIQFIFFIVDIPVMITVIKSGSYMLSALRSTVYGNEGLTNVTKNVWLNRLSLLYSGMRILATGFSVVAYITYKKNRRIVNLFALSALLNNIRIIIVQVGRGEMVLVFLFYAFVIYLMREWLDIKKILRLFLLTTPIIAIGVVFFWKISISRFGNQAVFYLYKYLGEPINNFNGILFKEIRGTTNGKAYFSLLYRYIFGNSAVISATDKWNIIYNATGIRGDIFYTWVGGVIIEFGKIAPFFVAMVLNRMLNKVAYIDCYYAGDIAVLLFFINFYIRGIFMFPTQNYEGLLMIVYTVVLYILFRIRRNKNGRLVYKVPRKKQEHIFINRLY